MPANASYEPLAYTSDDGLRLHARIYGPVRSEALPVICLPGLARTSADFHELASTLATDPERPRRVIALDYRGRGSSQRDPDPANYDIQVENGDIRTLLTICNIGRAAFIGTSRGGIHVMALSALRPCPIAAAVLNDIGPVIEKAGLMRIKGYVGKIPTVSSLSEGAAILKKMAGLGFTTFSDDDWLRLAERTFVPEGGVFATAYDPALMSSLSAISEESAAPELWHLFDGLAEIPLLVVRGGNSDILSTATLQAMQARRPDLQTMVIDGQAHAPPLWEPDVIARIAAFITRAETAASGAGKR